MRRKYYNTSKEMLEDAEYLLEATSNEVLFLWQQHKDTLDWGENNGGFLVTLGELDGHPVCIEISTCYINGLQVVSWNPTSMVVDHRMVAKFFNDLGFTHNNMTNVSNFHHLIHYVDKQKDK